MTNVEELNGKVNSTRIVISFLESRLKVYRERESQFLMELNQARRLEREAKELPL